MLVKLKRIMFLCWVLLSSLSFSQNVREIRKYEPVMIYGSTFPELLGAPVKYLYVYAYKNSTKNWALVPFQIDETTKGPDPLNPKDSLNFYFIPDEWQMDQHDGVFSPRDELVFLVRDCGDKAPPTAFIPNEEAVNFPKIEIEVSDSSSSAYVYLFQSSSITEPVPTPYEFNYFSENDSLSTNVYALDFSEDGLIEDMVIKTDGAANVDIFDTQKLRFSGILDLFIPLDIIMTEKNLYLYEDINVTPKPVVRLIRKTKLTLEIGSFISHDTPFWLRTKFYPYSGEFIGGASIAREDLKNFWPNSDAVVILENLRQSWDFNSNAAGMKLYNHYNDGIAIDGKADPVNYYIQKPIQEWTLVSGNQGSFFTFVRFVEEGWKDVNFYYYDREEGGQWDQSIFGNSETGDRKSFGDHGILFRSYGNNDISIKMNFFAYFIPEKNLQKKDGEQLFYSVLHRVKINTDIITSVENKPAIVSDFVLYQNQPNPFLQNTIIQFLLPRSSDVKLQIYDVNGRLVRTLVQARLFPGRQSVRWDGLNRFNQKTAAGIYFYLLTTPHSVLTKKFLKLQ